MGCVTCVRACVCSRCTIMCCVCACLQQVTLMTVCCVCTCVCCDDLPQSAPPLRAVGTWTLISIPPAASRARRRQITAAAEITERSPPRDLTVRETRPSSLLSALCCYPSSDPPERRTKENETGNRRWGAARRAVGSGDGRSTFVSVVEPGERLGGAGRGIESPDLEYVHDS